NIGVGNWNSARLQMSIDRGLVVEESLLVGAVRDRHNIDVLKLRAGFAPITMSQNVVPPDFATDFDFATRWNRPMKQGVESRNPNAGLRRFDVFEERGKATDDFARAQIFGHPIKLLQSDFGFLSARVPRIRPNFFWCELAF